jgi:hypothetical protein
MKFFKYPAFNVLAVLVMSFLRTRKTHLWEGFMPSTPGRRVDALRWIGIL